MSVLWVATGTKLSSRQAAPSPGRTIDSSNRMPAAGQVESGRENG